MFHEVESKRLFLSPVQEKFSEVEMDYAQFRIKAECAQKILMKILLEMHTKFYVFLGEEGEKENDADKIK